MGTTTEELKKLYAKLGGAEETAKDASTPGEVLNAINELDIGGGSGNLPPVTPEDNGKVLGVVNGNWAKTEVEAQIADESVTTAKLHDEAVTTDKMSDYAVTTDKVANEAITAEKIKIASRTRSKNAGEDGLSVSVTTENGQVTAVSGGIAPNTYDQYGAASTAKSEVIGTSEDDPDANTINGAKAYTDQAVANVAQSDWNQADNTQQDYIKNKPQLGTAASKNIPTSGNAGLTQVVMGNDTRLSDARSANDVYDWAKASAKPTYTPQEVGAIPSTEKGSASGVAELDENGKVLSSQLPSYVDDVLEGYLYNGKFYEDQEHTTEIPGEASKIYVELETNKTYRWTGNGYAEISESLALGETSSTAYRGDRGKAAYEHSLTTSGNPHHVTKEEVGLGNVGNFKAVSTEANQGLTTTEKANARSNIGAGTSSFDGNYNSLDNKPTLGTASAKDIPASGNASTSEVVMGNDTRLTDSRNAKDVSAWAKASTKPTYTAEEIGLGNVGNFKAVSTEANQGLTATEKANAKANLDLGTAAEKDIPVSGNASSGQVVMGNDTRLTDARPSSDVVQTYDATSEVPISGKGVSEALETVVPSKTASGNPIDIYDGANSALPKCVSAITGSQDLHGYDKPWVGGAGKNKYGNGDQTFTQAKQNIELLTPLSEGTYIFGALVESSDSDNTDCLIQLIDSNGAILASGRISRGVTTRTYLVLSWSGNDVVKLNLYAAASYANGAGDTASFTDIQIELGSTATAYEPYSNICPITAYTEGEIEVRGKNLLNPTSIVQGNITTPTLAGRCSTRGDKTILVHVGDTFSVVRASGNVRFALAVVDLDDDSLLYDSDWKTDDSFTYTSTYDGYAHLAFSYSSGSITPSDVIACGFMLEKGTSTTYEPYTSTTHTTTYPSAIYRGSEDVVNGEVTSEWVKVKLKDLTWTYIASSKFFYATNGGKKGGLLNIISNAFKTEDVNWSGGVNESAICGNLSNATIYIQTALYDNVTDFVAWLTTLDAEAAFEIPPTTSSVTPTNLPIKSLSGYTHIESTTGDMEIEYIAKAFQPLVDLIQSSKHVYSTEEQIVGTWVDGSYVYERTYITVLSGNSTTISIASLNADKAWVYDGFYDIGVTMLPLNEFITASSYTKTHVNPGSGYLYIDCTNSVSADSTIYVTIRYTKTTETR